MPVASGSQLTKVDKGFTELGKLGPGRAHPVPGVRRPGHRLLAGGRGVRGRPRRGAAGAPGHHRPLAGHRQPRRRPLRPRRRAPHRRRDRARQRRRGRRRASGCWPAPRACSPRPRAGSPWPRAQKLIESGQLDPDAETVLLITGDGLKTLDAVAGQIGPTATVPADQQGRPRGAGGPRASDPPPATGGSGSPRVTTSACREPPSGLARRRRAGGPPTDDRDVARRCRCGGPAPRPAPAPPSRPRVGMPVAVAGARR